MGLWIAVTGILMGIVAIVAIGYADADSRGTYYRLAIAAVGLVEVAALLYSTLLSPARVELWGTVVAIAGIVLLGLFIAYGDQTRAPAPGSGSGTDAGSGND